MLVVICSPTPLADEAAIINALFDDGLDILHLRKPGVTADEMRRLIEKLKPQFRHQIALHQHHGIAGDLGINRLHFTEAKRIEMDEEKLAQLKGSNNILSTSIHQTEAYLNLSPYFDYTFFGPVFNSISKQGYASALYDNFVFPVRLNHPKVIAIGGIDASNIQQAMDMKFDGVAILGAIWEKPNKGFGQFKLIQKAWKKAGR